MPTIETRAFKSGNSEAVRLPKEFAFGTDVELTMTRRGNVVTIQTKRPSMAELVAQLRAMPRPNEVEIRDTEEIPERPGL